MLRKIKQKLKGNISKKVIKKIFNFYNNLETIYPEELQIKETDKILILAPHADDESIGCGGLLLKHPSNINIICITDGRYGDPKISTKEMIEIRKKEFMSAMKFANTKEYEFLSVEDSKIRKNYKSLETINFQKFKMIFIPNYFDKHLDHKAVSSHIYKLIKNGNILSDTVICYYEVWDTVPFVNSFLDISEIINKKQQLINLYASQIKNIDYTDKVIALNKFRGLSLEVDYAECYMKLSTEEFINFMESK